MVGMSWNKDMGNKTALLDRKPLDLYEVTNEAPFAGLTVTVTLSAAMSKLS